VLFGGRKHGWSLRHKKSRTFCTLIPEKNRLVLLIVFGTDERTKVEAIRASPSLDTQEKYDEATTYNDGKRLLLTVNTDRVVKDVMLLAVKRQPKKSNNVQKTPSAEGLLEKRRRCVSPIRELSDASNLRERFHAWDTGESGETDTKKTGTEQAVQGAIDGVMTCWQRHAVGQKTGTGFFRADDIVRT